MEEVLRPFRFGLCLRRAPPKPLLPIFVLQSSSPHKRERAFRRRREKGGAIFSTDS
ncbi:MAG: hypothetical protein AVDCRST_MAG04-775 [uncultured Acetobacteraceae bacterium]|uniref:Uncharacterized protein n=1 Tax=uncultured Acetobacteraceae bacterium TaxID=169975 RepID=A0A6J4HJD3_9PROT|nr:MAG: hypothetical protein AVDCRST_MAG04-775 [uncultured Acetobacteraceae bacterium]